MQETGSIQYLREEMAAAREAVKALDKAVAEASSYRERASRLLEEAHRAFSRLELVRARGGPWHQTRTIRDL